MRKLTWFDKKIIEVLKLEKNPFFLKTYYTIIEDED